MHWRNKDPSKEKEPRELARFVLSTTYLIIDPEQSFPQDSDEFVPVMTTKSTNEILKYTNSRKLILEFIDDNGAIGKDLDALRSMLVQLSKTGKADRETIHQLADTLVCTVNQLRELEELHKRGINPNIAEKLAAIDQELSGLNKDCDDNPNLMEHQQVESLKCYNWIRTNRQVIEDIASGVCSILAALDRKPPGPNLAG